MITKIDTDSYISNQFTDLFLIPVLQIILLIWFDSFLPNHSTDLI